MEILQGLRADIKCLPVTKTEGEERRNGCGLQEWAEKQSLQHELRTQLNNTTFMKTVHTHPHTLMQEIFQGFMSVEFQW